MEIVHFIYSLHLQRPANGRCLSVSVNNPELPTVNFGRLTSGEARADGVAKLMSHPQVADSFH